MRQRSPRRARSRWSGRSNAVRGPGASRSSSRKTTPGGTRLYSEADVERLRIIQRLTTELGLNLAGVELVLRLEDELRKAHAQIERLQREAKQEVENVHKHYRRDLVLYREDRLPNRR